MTEARALLVPGETREVKLAAVEGLRVLILECDGPRGVYLDALAVDGADGAHMSIFEADVPVMARTLNGVRMAMPANLPADAHVVAGYRNLSAGEAWVTLKLEAE